MIDNLKDKSLILFILFFSFIVRLIYFFFTDGFSRLPIEDSLDYHAHAQNIRDFGQFFTLDESGKKIYSSRPPTLSFLLSIFYISSPETNIVIARFIQILISVGSIFLIFQISRYVGLKKIYALIPALVLCLYPPSIFYSSRILTENLAALLILVSIYLILRFFYEKELKFLLFSSISFLLLTLTRSSYLLLPFFIVFAIFAKAFFFKESKQIKELSLFLLCYVILLSPWSIRNYSIYGELVPTTTRLGYMLYLSNNTLDDPEVQKGGYSRKGELFYDVEFQKKDPLYKSKIYKEEVVKEVSANPKLFLSASKERFLNTLTWRPNPIARDHWVASDYVMFFIWTPLLLFFFFSITRVFNTFVFLSWICFTYVLLISLFFWGIPRLRYPVDPLVILLATYSFTLIIQKFKKNESE